MNFIAFTSLLFISTAAGAGPIVEKYCPSELVNSVNEDYLQVFHGSCFQFVVFKNRAYEAANEDCARHGGTLALPKTQEINDYLADKSFNRYHVDDAMWIGLRDQEDELTFIWEDGSHLDWSNFDRGQGPDNHWLATHVEDCVALDPVYGGKWHDYQCRRNWLASITGSDPRKRYICQYTLDVQEDQEDNSCQVFQCDKSCGLKGYQRDENDCQICECNGDQESQDGGDKTVEPDVTGENEGDMGVDPEDTDQQDGVDEEEEKPVEAPEDDSCQVFQCDTDCGMKGYKRNENDCQLCECNE